MSGSSILIVAGEASGDEHGAGLVNSLRRLDSRFEFFGMGGSLMRAAGVETIVDAEKDASVMGLTEVVSSIGKLYRAKSMLVEAAEKRRAAAAVLIDFPDFNMLLARALHGRGIKVAYFIAPQVWAWHKGRVAALKKYTKRIAAIFPFEAEFFSAHGASVEYVGHPFLDRGVSSAAVDAFAAEIGLDNSVLPVALLPGSRRSEINLLFPVMLEALRILRKENSALEGVVPVARTVNPAELKRCLRADDRVKLVSGRAQEVMRIAKAGVVASGTATVEAALTGTPFVALYRLSPITYAVARLAVRGVKYFAMPNLIAGDKVVPELLQNEANPERIAAEIRPLLFDEAERRKAAERLSIVRTRLEAGLMGGGTAYERTARLVKELLDK